MLQLQKPRIECALVDCQDISADLLNAPGDAVAVLRPQDTEGLEDHQRQRSLQDVRLFLHGESNLLVSNRNNRMVPFGKQQEICAIFRRQSRRAVRKLPGDCLFQTAEIEPPAWCRRKLVKPRLRLRRICAPNQTIANGGNPSWIFLMWQVSFPSAMLGVRT